jgi:hypothetical protein
LKWPLPELSSSDIKSDGSDVQELPGCLPRRQPQKRGRIAAATGLNCRYRAAARHLLPRGTVEKPPASSRLGLVRDSYFDVMAIGDRKRRNVDNSGRACSLGVLKFEFKILENYLTGSLEPVRHNLQGISPWA